MVVVVVDVVAIVASMERVFCSVFFRVAVRSIRSYTNIEQKTQQKTTSGHKSHEMPNLHTEDKKQGA